MGEDSFLEEQYEDRFMPNDSDTCEYYESAYEEEEEDEDEDF